MTGAVWTSYLTGVLVSGGLIIAIGAQNAYLLAQSLKREHHLPVAALCIFFDALLISLGVAGITGVLSRYPAALTVLRWSGVLFLLVYGSLALRRAWLGQDRLQAERHTPRGLGPVLLTTLGVTLLNPHVYLDTLVLVGSIGAQQAVPVAFVAGAVCASLAWFLSLAFGGAALAPLLARPAAWRGLDGLVAVMMFTVAGGLMAGPPGAGG